MKALSMDARAARKPLPPEMLCDALQDGIYQGPLVP